jgi:hypothetical protein
MRRSNLTSYQERIASMKMMSKIFTVAAIAAGFILGSANAADQQTLVVYGATGKIGGTIVNEALDRGHLVIGVSRDPRKFTISNENFAGVKGDVTDPASVAELTRGVDAVIVALSGNPVGNAPDDSTHAVAARTLIAVLGDMRDAPRVVQVGGATTMYGDKAEMLENLPFPAEEGTPEYGMLFGHLVALDAYRASDIDWTVVVPPLDLSGYREGDNTRTGEYRIETDKLVMDVDGKSVITVSDLSVAVVDEVENGNYVRSRLTVGY